MAPQLVPGRTRGGGWSEDGPSELGVLFGSVRTQSAFGRCDSETIHGGANYGMAMRGLHLVVFGGAC